MSGRDEVGSGPAHAELPLRDRLPEYLALFGVGLLAAGVVGAIIGALSSAGITNAIGYTMLGLGVVLLLAGLATVAYMVKRVLAEPATGDEAA